MIAHKSKIIGEGLTYDDVLLVPNYSNVLPREVSIQSKFSRNITLNVPIVSAAMDTVTASAMAIAMAQEGGIGGLHQNKSDTNARGHIGTELNNKAETVLSVTVSEGNNDISIVEPQMSRNMSSEVLLLRELTICL